MEKNAIIVVGGSAGSIEVIVKFIEAIPSDFPCAVVIVVHRKASTDNHLEDVLNRKSKIPVVEIYDKMQLENGKVFLVPGDYHLLVDKSGILSLDISEKVHYSRPSIDVTFECFATAFGKRCVGILLSGANSDGAIGLKKIKESGGKTIVQSPEFAAVATMPMAAINLFAPDLIADTTGLCNLFANVDFDGLNDFTSEIKLVDDSNGNLPRILMVDDLEDNLFALNAILKSEPYILHKASSGRVAIEMATKIAYDCIILDVQMPEMDGFEVANKLAQMDECKNIPILFLSALGSDKEKVVRGIESGAIDFLDKPPVPELLKAKLKLCVKISSKTKETSKVVKSVMQEHLRMQEYATDVSASLRYAQNIQQAVLPHPQTVAAHFNQSFIFFQPKESIGGDFYFIKEIDGEIVLVCGDCTGHGIPGAMMTMISVNIIRNIVENKSITRPDLILTEVLNEFRSSFKNDFGNISIHDGLELAICTFRRRDNMLLYSGAGRPIVRCASDTVDYIKSNPYGINGNTNKDTHFPIYQFNVQPGDRFYMFTDGAVDQFGGPDGKKFMIKRLVKIFTDGIGLDLSEQYLLINKTINDWKGHQEQVDDILVVGIGF